MKDRRNGNTPLHLAVSMDNEDIVRLLIAQEVDINAINNNNETPLHLANMTSEVT